MSALDDEQYVAAVTQAMAAAKGVLTAEGYSVDGIVVLVEADRQGVTIVSDLEDDAIRDVMVAAVGRLSTAERRNVPEDSPS